MLDRTIRGWEIRLFTVQEESAFVWPVDAAKYLTQGALSCPVLADKGKDFALHQAETYGIDCLDPREGLGDALSSEDFFH